MSSLCSGFRRCVVECILSVFYLLNTLGECASRRCEYWCWDVPFRVIGRLGLDDLCRAVSKDTRSKSRLG